MPNKYEREIEEILRNMERTEPPQQGLSDRIRAFNRPRPRTRAPRRWRTPLTTTESLFLTAVVLAIAARSLTYYIDQVIIAHLPIIGDLTVNGLLALGAFIALFAALLRGWRERFRLGASARTWRGNVVDMHPRRNPFSVFATQYRIFRLKYRYWRSRGKE